MLFRSRGHKIISHMAPPAGETMAMRDIGEHSHLPSNPAVTNLNGLVSLSSSDIVALRRVVFTGLIDWISS